MSGLLSLTEKNEEKQGITQQSPLYSFMYALKSSEARRQYPKRLKMLFDFLGLSASLEEQANEFLDKARQNIQWSQDSIMKFLDFHKQRVRRKELAADNIFFRFSIRLTSVMVSFVRDHSLLPSDKK
jgi:hypothetical protein